jgi:molybdopterin synthase catalytic subunit
VITAHVEIRIETADFDVGVEVRALYRRLAGSAGAVATFIGLVRERTPSGDAGTSVTGLYLEHYPGMTEASIARIVDQSCTRWPLTDVVVIHRVGRLPPAAQIVYVQVASGHRDAAFAGAQYLMDYLKTDAVFWKREEQGDHARWVEATASDRARRGSWEADENA